MNTRSFVRGLSDRDLKQLASEVHKEQRRRKKIEMANNTWICNEGLEVVLEASIENGSR